MDCRVLRHGAKRCQDSTPCSDQTGVIAGPPSGSEEHPAQLSSCRYTNDPLIVGRPLQPGGVFEIGREAWVCNSVRSRRPERGITQSAGSASPGNLRCPTISLPVIRYPAERNLAADRLLRSRDRAASVHAASVTVVVVEYEVLPVRRPAAGPQSNFGDRGWLHQRYALPPSTEIRTGSFPMRLSRMYISWRPSGGRQYASTSTPGVSRSRTSPVVVSTR